MAKNQEEWLTRAEAAAKLRKSVPTIDRYKRDNPGLFIEGIGMKYLGSTPLFALSAFEQLKFKKRGVPVGYKRP